MAAFTRRQYKGAAVSTTTTNSLNTSDTSVTIASNTGWPSSAGVPFYVVIDPGTSAEEKCSATISGTTLTLTRAQDDTTASAHSSGATIYPVFTANDADEANELVSKLTTKGDLLVTDGSALNRLAVGTNDYVLKADSTATNGVAWGQVAAGGIASDAVTTAKILDSNVTGAKLANLSVSTKTASYTLVAADRNTRVVMNSASATTITVNTSLFSAGDVVWIHNIGAGTCTVTAGTATVTTSGSLALAQWGGGSLYFTSASAAIFFPAGGTVNTLSVDYFLVGGGGGGGRGQASLSAGGGGAGGFVTGSGIIGKTTYTIKVGAGGTGSTSGSYSGRNGTASSFISSANGGGSGASPATPDTILGQNGASGGGGCYAGSGGATGVSGEGSDGGSGYLGASGGGGGGGIGSTGGNATSNTGGAGGSASTNSYTGSSISYSGGGGGGGNTTGGTAGTNAGNGGSNAAGSNATANRGGGGGGGSGTNSGGNGGSGRVVVRWLTANATGLSISVTGTTTNGTDGSYTWYAWDSTGTLVVA